MTQTPQGRNRRADRHNRPEDVTPKPSAPRTRQPRAPIGRSQELLERQEQLRQSMQTPAQQEPVRSQRMTTTYSDFAQQDFSELIRENEKYFDLKLKLEELKFLDVV